MSTGDEPMLSDPAGADRSSDNAPMISGRGTKIMVTARGAYTIGNLRAMCDLMDDSEKDAFKRIVIECVLEDIADRIRICNPQDRWHSDLNEYVDIIRAWLTSDDAAYDAVEVLEDRLMQHSTDFGLALECLVQGIIANSPADTAKESINALEEIYTGSSLYNEAFMTRRLLLERWHLNVAWSILARHLSPLPPLLDEISLQQLTSDFDAMVQLQHLDALIYLLGDDLHADFERIALREALNFFEYLFTEHKLYEADHRWLDMLRGWLNNETPISTDEYRQHIDRMPHFSHLDLRYKAVYSLSLAFEPVIYAAIRAKRLMIALGYASLAVSNRQSGALNTDSPEVRPARRWLVEVASAVFHGQAAPPFELSS